MPRFAANLSMMYTELAFLDRFKAAAEDGFDAVECLFPYDVDPLDIAARLNDHGLTQVLINAPCGDFAAGERGMACLPGREDDFRRAIEEDALPYAAALGCTRIHVMAGVPRVEARSGSARDALRATYLHNLEWAAKVAATGGVTILIEPINHRDFPGYFLNTQQEAHDVVTTVGAANLRVQMDLYHCQITEGDLSEKLRQYLPTGRVGHIQIAGVPTRNEPNVGELNYPYLLDLVDELGYAGFVSAEYRPRAGTSAGLDWLRSYRA